MSVGDKRRIDHERVLALWRQGVPVKAIARRVGCTARSVTRIIREEREKCPSTE